MSQTSYYNFINSLRAEETKTKYKAGLKDFMKFVEVQDFDSLLKIEVEKSIIDYVVFSRDKVSSSSVHNRLASIYHFYTMNDVLLNKTKISKYKGEFIRTKKDRAYTNVEIGKLISNADLRMKVCILLMASSGLRLGALPLLKLKNIENNRIVRVYEASNEEYFTFLTPETRRFIQEYLEYRKRSSEKISANSYLIRDHFDDFEYRKPRGITKHAIREIIYHLLKKAGIGENVSMTHGFRKFFTTQLINSKVNPEIREMLLGHKIGLASCYYRPTQEDMYSEYEKAIDALTINEENRLRKKVETLTIDDSRLERLERIVERLNRVAS